MARKPATPPQAAALAVQRLVESAGIELRPQGQDLVGPCPRHGDDCTPLVVHPKRNTWECPACKKKGGAVEWVMFAQSLSRSHAVELLRQDAYEPGRIAPGSKNTIPTMATVIEPGTDDAVVLAQVAAYYHDTLKQSAEALAYLERRGLRHPDLIDHFRLGFSNRTLPYRLPQKSRKAGAEIREQLERLGILRPSGHEYFRGSLILPVMDDDGRIVQVYGRKITPHLRKGTPDHTWLPGAASGIVNAACLSATTDVILSKSPTDMWTLWAHGHRNVVCPVAGDIDAALDVLKQRGVKKVTLAFRRDKDGIEQSDAVAEKLVAAGLEAWRIEFPSGMDGNDFARMADKPEQRLTALVRNATWLGKGRPPSKQPIEAVQPDQAPHDDVVLVYGDRRWRIRGFGRGGVETMKVNLMVSRNDGFHVDTIELYSSRQRSAFIKQAADELGVDDKVIKADLGRVLLHLEQRRDELVQAAEDNATRVPELSDADRNAAMDLLRSPHLLDRIADDFERCGLVGERTNLLVAFLAAVSRKLDDPLGVLIQSPSAAGKTSLMDAVLSFVPEEDRLSWSAMTGQSLFYVGEADLKHKVLAIAEEEGAERAAYALKLLQSEGVLTMASTSKDAGTGRLVTKEYRVEGPVALMLTTTGIDVDEELANRCIVLSVDDSRDQTRLIHERQRHDQTLEGMLERQARDRTMTLHRNAQRLLRPIMVVNPSATSLTFADHQTRTRRDHAKYLTLIRAIALLHQHQRQVKTADHQGVRVEYIEATTDDIAAANELAHEALGRSLDELPPQTRNLLGLIRAIVLEDCEGLGIAQSDYRFTRRSIRERIAWGNTQLRVHLARLIDMEYVVAHRSGMAVAYELCWDGHGTDGRPFLNGLADGTTEAGGLLAGPKRPRNGPETGGWRGAHIDDSGKQDGHMEPDADGDPENAPIGATTSSAPYTQGKG